jgi:hypothetical protein
VGVAAAGGETGAAAAGGEAAAVGAGLQSSCRTSHQLARPPQPRRATKRPMKLAAVAEDRATRSCLMGLQPCHERVPGANAAPGHAGRAPSPLPIRGSSASRSASALARTRVVASPASSKVGSARWSRHAPRKPTHARRCPTCSVLCARSNTSRGSRVTATTCYQRRRVPDPIQMPAAERSAHAAGASA